jgi:hypothetical protein
VPETSGRDARPEATRRAELAASQEFRHAARVPHDEVLAARIRALAGDEDGVCEQRMFGGLAFNLNRNMAVAASGQGGAERWSASLRRTPIASSKDRLLRSW